jgi:uncharacterized membrane protein
MNRSFAAIALSSAIGLALALPVAAAPAGNPDVIKKTQERMAANHMEMCFGISANGKNDCASSSHACAGQQTVDRDPDSFVLVAEGTCGNFSGGSLQPQHR